MDATVRIEDCDVLVIGSGLAGMTAALELAPRKVTLLTKTAGLPGGSSLYAQGGIAAAVGDGDTAEDHAADTLAAGAGLVDPVAAELLTSEGALRVAGLAARGLPFDRDENGKLHLGREAAHGRARVAHAGGDATGRVAVEWLAAHVQAAPSIRVVADTFAVDLVTRGAGMTGGRIFGASAWSARDGWTFFRAPHVVLATGGVGACFSRTTNPAEATGDGLAMAARAGALLADLEFVQFHPTALAVDGDGPAPLLTEALRGAGAVLLDGAGRRFMLDEHPLAELAPRDVVARAVGKRAAAGETVLLDLRPALAHEPEGFPTVLALCAEHGFDPFEQPVPVAPAAHYHMGGVWTDGDGRTSLKGLWACGETACTGVHGANRLASNSLLEALVFGGRVASAIAVEPPSSPAPVAVPEPPTPHDPVNISAVVRRALYQAAGLVRDGMSLRAALLQFDALADRLAAGSVTGDVRGWGEARNRLTAARLICQSAFARKESRGAHCRADFPHAAPRPLRRMTTMNEPFLDNDRQAAAAAGD
jgi:L-aspartate oxidase